VSPASCNAETMPTCAARKLLDLLGPGEVGRRRAALMRAVLPRLTISSWAAVAGEICGDNGRTDFYLAENGPPGTSKSSPESIVLGWLRFQFLLCHHEKLSEGGSGFVDRHFAHDASF